MREMSVRELRDSLSSIEEILDREREVMLTRHGRALAKLVTVNPGPAAPSHADLRAQTALLARPSEELIRADRERG